MSQKYQCKDCVYLFIDNRLNTYRSAPFYFCQKKGNLHSRNYKIGEGTRISLSDDACEYFILKNNKGRN